MSDVLVSALALGVAFLLGMVIGWREALRLILTLFRQPTEETRRGAERTALGHGPDESPCIDDTNSIRKRLPEQGSPDSPWDSPRSPRSPPDYGAGDRRFTRWP